VGVREVFNKFASFCRRVGGEVKRYTDEIQCVFPELRGVGMHLDMDHLEVHVQTHRYPPKWEELRFKASEVLSPGGEIDEVEIYAYPEHSSIVVEASRTDAFDLFNSAIFDIYAKRLILNYEREKHRLVISTYKK